MRARVPGGQAELARRERAESLSRERGATLERLRQAAGEGGRETLLAAGRAGGDPLAIAIVGWELAHGMRQAHPALTSRRREHLVRYCRIIDRIENTPGMGVAWLLDVMETHARLGGELVCSLDYFVCGLRRWVRTTRRYRKGKPRLPHEKTTWYDEREERRADAVARARRRRAGRGEPPGLNEARRLRGR